MAPVELKPSDTLVDVARRYGVGYQEMKRANPGVDLWVPGADSAAMVPTRFILPAVPRMGIVLNIAEMRLYYFPPPDVYGGQSVITYPVSVGRMDWKTPLGVTSIVRKKENPTWTPPASIRKEHAAEGDILPDVVPAGPDNPLGEHALYLARSGYLLHGTNRPQGIGMRVTHGCVRLYPENVADLYERVPVGTEVRIIDEPYKAGWQGSTFYLEVHPRFDDQENRQPADLSRIQQVIVDAAGVSTANLDWTFVEEIAAEAAGIPIPLNLTR